MNQGFRIDCAFGLRTIERTVVGKELVLAYMIDVDFGVTIGRTHACSETIDGP
jgi:hypothetical protein